MYVIREGLISLYSFLAAVFVPIAVLIVAMQHFAMLSKLELCGSIVFISYAVINGLFLLKIEKTLMQVKAILTYFLK